MLRKLVEANKYQTHVMIGEFRFAVFVGAAPQVRLVGYHPEFKVNLARNLPRSWKELTRFPELPRGVLN
jgi:hypothetical protein